MKIEDLHHIKPIDCDNGTRWYPIIDRHNAETRNQVIHCISNTTVLGYAYPKDQYLLDWMKREGANADVIRDEKAKEGLRVDWGTEKLDKGKTLHRAEYNTSEWKALMSYVRWVEEYDPLILAVQATVYDRHDRVAGTLDKIVEINGEPILVDIKKTSGIRPTHIVQVQTYARLLKVMGIEVPKVAILRLGTKHKVGYEWHVEDYDEDVYERTFLACLHLWQQAHPKATGPYIERLPETLTLPPMKNQPVQQPLHDGHSRNGRH